MVKGEGCEGEGEGVRVMDVVKGEGCEGEGGGV